MEEEMSEFFVNGKDAVTVVTLQEFEGHGGRAFLTVFDTAGRAEAAFASEGDKFHFRMKELYMKRIDTLDIECDAIEKYVEEIGDSVTRRIFRMYFLEGSKQKEIAKAVHMDRSVVSRRINNPALYSEG